MAERKAELRATAAVGDVSLIDGRVPNRIMLLPIGELVPRDGRKPWFVKDRSHAEQIVTATQERLGKTAFMLDYDHQSRLAPKVAGRAAAAGWVEPSGFHVEDDGIYADVEWTPAARAELKDRHYRYLSPDFGHTEDGRVTRLFAAALTNTPALEIPALASAEHESDQEEYNVKYIALKLGLAEDATEDSIISAIDGLQNSTSHTAIATALGLDESATVEQVATAASEAAARPEPVSLAPIAAALGEAEDADVERLATAAAELVAGKVDASKYVPIETYNALKAKVDGDAEQQAIAAVDAAIEGGKIAPANRDFYLESARRDIASFQAFALSAPELLKSGEEEERGSIASDELTDEERATCAVLGVSEEDYLQTKKELA